MTQTIDINKAIREAQEYAKSLNLKTYKLMYFHGVWYTHKIFSCESEREAIFDADHNLSISPNMQNWKYKVALWCGNRMVKQYR